MPCLAHLVVGLDTTMINVGLSLVTPVGIQMVKKITEIRKEKEKRHTTRVEIQTNQPTTLTSLDKNGKRETLP